MTLSICLQEDREAESDALSVAVGAEVRQKEAELAAAKGSFEKDKARHIRHLPELRQMGGSL